MADARESILTTCPRDCYDTCGIMVIKHNGVIHHVRGAPQHPVSRGKLCVKCSIGYNREWRDPQARLIRPLRRVGPKGEGRFEPVSWDTALTAIAERLEFDDLVASYFQLTLSAQVKAMEPLGEALPNQEIFRRLARAMGYTEPELYESDAAILTTLLHRANLGESFASLAAKGTIPVPLEPVVPFADRTFPTPSGRIEIASARSAADGHPRIPLPLADPRPAGGRLRLLSPASPWHLNDSFANVAQIAAHIGPATIALHPADAAERGLAEGSEALVANEVGHLLLSVTLAETLPRGVALSHKGHWPKREAARANVNVLNPGQKSDMGESTCVHSIEVTVSPLKTS